MAIFRLAITPVRKAGSTLGRAAHHTGTALRKSHGAAGKAAYLSASRHVGADGLVTDYRGKHGVEHSELILSGGGTCDREKLWNAVDAHKTQRETAVVARDMIVAFPHELSFDERKQAARALARWVVDRYGVAVDYALHQPETHKGSSEKNFHGHFLISERLVSPAGELGQVQRELNAMAQRMADPSRGRDGGGNPTAAAEIRVAWERIANEVLEQGGHAARIDRRSLKDRGIDRAPEQKLGPAATRRLRAGLAVQAELARAARDLAIVETTALREIAAIQEARRSTPAPQQMHAEIGSIVAWERDAVGMLARYWQAEDRAMELRRKTRASARRHSEMREATAEEAKALRGAGRRLSRSRALLQGVDEALERMPDSLALDLEPSEESMTKRRLQAIRAAMRPCGEDRSREHTVEIEEAQL